MRAVVVKAENAAGRWFAVADKIAEDVLLTANGCVQGTNHDCVYNRYDPPTIPEGGEVELICVVYSHRGYHAPVWRVDTQVASLGEQYSAISAKLEPVTLKFFNEGRGYGFLVTKDEIDLFAHIGTFRIIESDGSLRRPRKDEITAASFGPDPAIECIRGTGRDGRPAATLWLVSPK